MNTNENTIYRDMVDHIGQMDVKLADNEVIRMENQFPNTKWRKDFSQFLEDNDWDCPRPSELKDGYCWVVRDYK